MANLEINPSTTFDGSTPLPAGSFVKQSSGLYLATIVGAVGLLTGAQLGASYGGVVHVQWLGDAAGEVEQIHNAVTFKTIVGPDADLVLYPEDQIALTSVSASSILFRVAPFANEAELKEYTSRRAEGLDACCNDPDFTNYSEVTVLVAGQLAGWTGRRTAFLDLAGAGIVELPALGDVALGDQITLVRIGGDLPEVRTDDAGDQVNGEAGLGDTAWWLRNVGESITYTRVSGGWSREQGQQAPTTATVAAFPADAPEWHDGTAYAAVVPVGLSAYNLPALADVKIGQRLLVVNTGTAAVIVQPDAGEQIDGRAGISRNVRPFGSMMFESAGSTWVTGRGSEDPDPISSALAVLLNVPFYGIQEVELTGAAAGIDCTLPLTSILEPGTMVQVFNNSATMKIVLPAGADTIDGSTGSVLLNAGSRGLFVSAGGGAWRSVLGQNNPAAINSAKSPITLVEWRGVQIVTMTGAAAQNLALPAAASMRAGDQVVVWNNSANAHTITPNGADTVNGAGGAFAQATTARNILTSDGVSNWVAT
ncbi:MAG: hypothetical protein R3B09_32290 [Nannocystaceae bacterium]